MKLYDDLISEWNARILQAEAVRLPLASARAWKESDAHGMIFSSDMAYELGGGTLHAKGVSVVTESRDLVAEDEVLVIGKDLPEISKNLPYARITMVRVAGDRLGEGDALYSAIRNIEFAKYHVAPEGFMLRVSSMDDRESARVSKSAMREGISFAHVASHYMNTLHKNNKVEAVRMIFVTDPAFDFGLLDADIKRAKEITKTIDHIFKDTSIMDCKACNLQAVCEEVEGLRELHFAQNQK